MNDSFTHDLNQHYSENNLTELILDSLKKNGVDTIKLTREDIEQLDEFHIGGRKATRDLAEYSQLEKGSDILDLGCGIGGPARTLADEFDCRVTGIDLTREYIKTAGDLTKLIGLDDKIEFLWGDATDLSFDSREFDIVWMQHMTMNIEDKARLFREAYRVLKPTGQIIFYEILKQNEDRLHYPVFWAESENLSFLIKEDGYKKALTQSGFEENQWENRSDFAIDWFEKRIAKAKNNSSNNGNNNFTIHRNTPQKAANVLRNLQEERISVVRAVYTKV